MATLSASKSHVGSFFSEFKQFITKGNLIDLAVAVILGTAFAKMLDSLVKNIILPLINLAVPGAQDYVQWKAVVRGKEIPYGLFIGDLVTFLLIALVLFIFLVKMVGWLMRSKKQDEAAPAVLTKDQQLLSDIKDILSEQHSMAGTTP